MTYRNYFLLDLRELNSPQKLCVVSAVENVCFLLYDAELSADALQALRRKCSHVLRFLPIAKNINLDEFFKYARNL